MRRFRVPYNGIFYYVRLAGELLVLPHHDRRDTLSERLFRTGNYYTTRSGAEDVANKFKAILEEHDRNEGCYL